MSTHVAAGVLSTTPTRTCGLSIDPNDLPCQFGDFTLLRLIAQGGMGAVYLALRPVELEESRLRHLPEGQEEVCVVKTVRADLKADREAVGRFLDEARVVQKLEHPRIARTLDAGVIDKTYFLALEFISGRNLRDVHTRAQKLGKALPEALIVHVLSEMLEALDYAHKLKDPDTDRPLHIVHRDISPHNVMLGFDGATRLIDFGLAAHELKRELTRPGVMVGKLRYNAPEQVRDRALDGRSDIYSAGVVLYEFLANERFYEGLPEEQVWRVAMMGDHRPRSWRDIDTDWRHLLDVALQNDPEKRYKDARAFRMALLDVAEARNVDLSGMRKASKAFMAEIFAREQVQEREMLLQATGIAEARTRLFRSPSELQEAIANIPAQAKPPGAAVADMRTEILDTNAGHLLHLRDLMSQLADPNAETMLPEEPVDSGAGPRVSADDATGDGPSLSEAARVAAQRHLAGQARRLATAVIDDSLADASAERSVEESAEDSAHAGPDPRFARAAADDPPPTVVHRRRHSGSGPSHPGEAPPPVEPPSTTGSSRRPRRAEPLPPLPPKVAPRRVSPVVALLLGLLAVTLVGVVAIAAIPRLLGTPPTTLALTDVDAGGAPEPPPPEPPTVPVPEPAPAPEPPPAPAPEPPPPTPPPPTPPRSLPPSRPKGPPAKVPSTLPGQLGYLKQHCVGRVQCARSLVGDAENFTKLSPAELKELKEAVPRCIEKCQRN
jgi:serine/threonine-protein kinase